MAKEMKASTDEKKLVFTIAYVVPAKSGCDIQAILDMLKDEGGTAEVVDVKIKTEKETA